jgi:peroxiredoxin Q/BCP
MPKTGTKAIDFSLKDKDGKAHSLKDIKSDFIVLYFYPKDNTPGCTIEANGFNKDLDKYKKLKTAVIGISGGDEKSKTKFCEKNKLTILLLSDTDFSVSKKYGVYGEKSFMGHKYLGISRTTFILDKDRKIIKIYEKVNPISHSKEVIAFLTIGGG